MAPQSDNNCLREEKGLEIDGKSGRKKIELQMH
jgi:hypothetical protein